MVFASLGYDRATGPFAGTQFGFSGGGEVAPFNPLDYNPSLLLDPEQMGGRHAITAVGDAKITTAITDPFGESKGVGTFDGTGDYLSSPDSPEWNLGLTCTLEGWVKFSSIGASDQVFFCQSDNPQPTPYWYLYKTNTNTFRLLVDGAQDVILQTTNAVFTTTGVWYHFAVVLNAGTPYMFINGISQTLQESMVQAWVDVVKPLFVGGFPLGSEVDGQLSNMRISNNARYTANFDVPTEPFTTDTNTLFLAPMTGSNNSTAFVDEADADDTGAIGSWNDISGNYNHIREATNQPTNQSANLNGYDIVRGDGVNDKLVNAIAQAQPATIIIVAKVTASAGANPLFGDSNAWVGLTSDEYATAYAGSNVSDSADHSASWKIYAFVINGASSIVYVEGVSVATGDAGAGNLAAMNLFTEGSNFAQADVAQAMMFPSALAPGVITSAYNTYKTKFGL